MGAVRSRPKVPSDAPGPSREDIPNARRLSLLLATIAHAACVATPSTGGAPFPTEAGVSPAPALPSFRRAFALQMLQAGTDLLTLQRLLGHADLSPLKRYAKQNADDRGRFMLNTPP